MIHQYSGEMSLSVDSKQERAPCIEVVRLLGRFGLEMPSPKAKILFKGKRVSGEEKVKRGRKPKLDVFIAHKGARLYPPEHFDELVAEREKIRISRGPR